MFQRKSSILKVMFGFVALYNVKQISNVLNLLAIDVDQPVSQEAASDYEKFDLQKKIPHTQDAQQVFIENRNMLYVGVFDVRTDAITIMPALPKNFDISYNENNEVTHIQPKDKQLSKEEIKVLTEQYKMFIPRWGHNPCMPKLLSSHELTLINMGVPVKALGMWDQIFGYFGFHPYAPLYGFSVSRDDEAVTVYRTSRSLNYIGKSGLSQGFSQDIPLTLKEKIEKTFYEWLRSNENTNTSQCLLPTAYKK